jgi:energy-coupling factor transporter transmembrane protein EcfT
MHSGLILLFWLGGVMLLQTLPAVALLPAVSACLAVALLLARRRCLRLLRRVRFLLLAIVVLFAWFTPGEALLAGWPQLSPSREGAFLALQHAARLVGVIAGVALLLEVLPRERLVGGMYALCRPLALLRVSPERLALRLLLVLRYVESADADTPRHWRHWLADDHAPVEVEVVHLVRERPGALDWALGGALMSLILWWGLQ